MISHFRTLSYYEQVPAASFPEAATFATATSPSGSWPSPRGGAGRTGRAADPLVHDSFGPGWRVPLGPAEFPDEILLGAGRVLVGGAERALWTLDGKPRGNMPREGRLGSLIDETKRRIVAHDVEGLGVYTLEGARESSVRLSAPRDAATIELLQGPDALVLVSLVRKPHAAATVFAESVRVRSYDEHKDGVLYGVEPLGGITREDDATIAAAAAPTGPVLATSHGLDWRDWQLRPLAGCREDLWPIAMSVDEAGTAYVISGEASQATLRVFSSDGSSRFQLSLPADAGPFHTPPLITPSGQLYLVSPLGIFAFAADGAHLWTLSRGFASAANEIAPASLSSNGLLLLGGDTLDAVTGDGRTVNLWWPPAPIMTAPILAYERIYVATDDTLFALEPV